MTLSATSRRYLFLSIAVCALSSCADGTEPDLSQAEYLFRAVAGGEHHTCGIGADSTVFCWGYNGSGQLGNGTTDDAQTPPVVDFSSPFVALNAGRVHTCGLTADSVAYCWGDNWYGELGDGTNEYRRTPRSVATGVRFAEISAGDSHTCGLAADGAAYCWGENYHGALGATTTEFCEAQLPCSTIPLRVSGSITFERIAAGWEHTCGIATDGVAYCWGDNSSGQLGDGSTEDRASPTALASPIRLAMVSAGTNHTCGVSDEGVVYCWGSNTYGELGDDSGALGWLVPIAVWGW